ELRDLPSDWWQGGEDRAAAGRRGHPRRGPAARGHPRPEPQRRSGLPPDDAGIEERPVCVRASVEGGGRGAGAGRQPGQGGARAEEQRGGAVALAAVADAGELRRSGQRGGFLQPDPVASDAATGARAEGRHEAEALMQTAGERRAYPRGDKPVGSPCNGVRGRRNRYTSTTKSYSACVTITVSRLPLSSHTPPRYMPSAAAS